MNRLKEKVVAEGKQFFWIFVYLWVVLGLFSIRKSVVLHERTLIYHQGFALINALILAKIMLIAEMFHIGNNLKNKPLIYPVIFKSAVFSVILMACSILEETLTDLWRGKAISIAIGGRSLKGVLVVGINRVCFNYPTLGDLYKYATYEALLKRDGLLPDDNR
jgi:hypothetical protein